jgi:bifunctional non-homologous end joining protein LigD
MLASPWPGRFDDGQWVFELKWDGVRCIAGTGTDTVSIRSRRGNDMSQYYPELTGLDLPTGLVLDGEIVALDEKGRPSFERLQGRMNRVPVTRDSVTPITYVVFDVLFDGQPLLETPLERRVDRLMSIELPPPLVHTDQFLASSSAIWDFVIENDLEGIVAKRLGSRYLPGKRSPDWRKIANFKQLRAVVGGYTPGTGARESSFGALLLGLWDADRLRWIGAVGSGFNDRSLAAIRAALDEMTVPACPFFSDKEIPKGSVWIEPQLVAMVRYKEWTLAGRVRAPSLLGFTDDPVEAVTWDAEGPKGGR